MQREYFSFKKISSEDFMEHTKHGSFFTQIFSSDEKITNKIKYTILQCSCATVHFLLILFFAYTGVMPMVIFNIASTLIYIFSGMLVKKEKYILLYYITFVEICMHSYTATILVGWELGFPLYIVAIMPVIFYMHFSLSESSMHETLLIGICCLLTFVTCKFISYRIEPIYEVSETAALWIYIFNSLCTFAMLMFFSMLFLREMQCSHAILEEQNARLDKIAGIDALTGLYNRRSMDKFISNAVNSGKCYSLIMCDIDDFKKVNDTYGHDAGDIVLKNIADAIVSGLREGDYVCRWGGEEILILATGTPLTAAQMVSERVRQRVEAIESVYRDTVIKCTVTVGAAESSECDCAEDTISLADKRLYKGKKIGKNCVVIS